MRGVLLCSRAVVSLVGEHFSISCASFITPRVTPLSFPCHSRVFVADTDNNRVSVFEIGGQYVKSLGADGRHLRSPLGLALGYDGTVLFVVDSGNHCVKVSNGVPFAPPPMAEQCSILPCFASAACAHSSPPLLPHIPVAYSDHIHPQHRPHLFRV